jgi:glycosyltransferase involved in cell wall biosynthesis
VRIVFLDPSGELGGAETALLEVLAALREARPGWTLSLVTSAEGPLIDRASALGVSATALPFPAQLAQLGEWGQRLTSAAQFRLALHGARAALPTLAYTRRLGRHLAALNPDVLHTNGLKMHVLGARCRPGKARVLWHLHDYPDARPLSRTLLESHAHRCSVAVANSESVAIAARRLFGDAIRVHAVHNAVDLDRFSPDGHRLDLDAAAGLPPLAANGIKVGLIGTFARWKGHDVFLKALAEMNGNVPVRGYVVGGPIYQTTSSQFSIEELREMGARLNPGSVAFVGPVSDVPAAMRALDIVVHASVEPEPFGLVVAEAMACGRPVVVSRAGGAAEIAQQGAVFHQPGDHRDLAARIAELAAQPSLRATLGAAGRAAASLLFSRARLATRLVPLYESIN